MVSRYDSLKNSWNTLSIISPTTAKCSKSSRNDVAPHRLDTVITSSTGSPLTARGLGGVSSLVRTLPLQQIIGTRVTRNQVPGHDFRTFLLSPARRELGHHLIEIWVPPKPGLPTRPTSPQITRHLMSFFQLFPNPEALLINPPELPGENPRPRMSRAAPAFHGPRAFCYSTRPPPPSLRIWRDWTCDSRPFQASATISRPVFR